MMRGIALTIAFFLPAPAFCLGGRDRCTHLLSARQALLEMSQDVLRAAFSTIVAKRVYTLGFDRSSPECNSQVTAPHDTL